MAARKSPLKSEISKCGLGGHGQMCLPIGVAQNRCFAPAITLPSIATGPCHATASRDRWQCPLQRTICFLHMRGCCRGRQQCQVLLFERIFKIQRHPPK